MTLEAIGGGSVVLALVAIIGYLLRQNYLDRKQYQDHIAEVQKSTAAAIAAAKKSSGEEIARLGAKVDALSTLYEQERSKRWQAEDDAAKYRRLHEAAQPGGGSQ